MPETTDQTRDAADQTQDTEHQQSDQQQSDQQSSQTPDEAAGLKKALESEREARKTLDKQFKTTKAELDKLMNAGKSESEKLIGERDDLKSKLNGLSKDLRERNAKDAVIEAATAAGVSDAANLSKVWRMFRGDLKYTDDGAVSNLDELIREEKAKSPDLFKIKVGTADVGAGHRSAASQGNDWIRANIERRR